MSDTLDAIKQMAAARVRFYKGEIRSEWNEWILQELEEWGDEVQLPAYRSWKDGIITQEYYQQIVSAAREPWIILHKEIEKHESRSGSNPCRLAWRALCDLVRKVWSNR